MALKLDDFLSKKKEPAQVLDLSRVKIASKEELKKYLERVPEYKIKAEKVSGVAIRDKDWSTVPGRKEAPPAHPHVYLDPTPPDMKTIHLSELCPVTIDWKMLTTLRPKTKLDDDFFSRLVALGKLDLKEQQQLKRSKDSDWVRRSKNPKSSIVETRVLSCPDCGEDFCDGSVCGKLTYDNSVRPVATSATGVVKDGGGTEGADEGEAGGRRRRRRRRRVGLSAPRLRKNSIFNRAPVRGCTRDHSRRERHAAAVVRSRSTSRDAAVAAGGQRQRQRRARSVSGQRRRATAGAQPRAASASPHLSGASRTNRIHFAGVDSSADGDTDASEGATGAAATGGSLSRRFVRQCTLHYSHADLWHDPYHHHHQHQHHRPLRSDGDDSTSASDSEAPAAAAAAPASAPARVLRPPFAIATLRLQLDKADAAPQQERVKVRRRHRGKKAYSAASAIAVSPSVTHTSYNEDTPLHCCKYPPV